MFVFRHKFIDKFLRCQTALFTFRVRIGREKRGQMFRVIKVLGFFLLLGKGVLRRTDTFLGEATPSKLICLPLKKTGSSLEGKTLLPM